MAIPFEIIVLDRPYEMRLGLKTTVAFEKMTGKKFIDVGKELESGELSMTTVAELTQAMLLKERPGITLDEVCDLVDEHTGDISVIINKVIKAITAAYEDDEAKGDDPNAKAPIARKANIFRLRKNSK